VIITVAIEMWMVRQEAAKAQQHRVSANGGVDGRVVVRKGAKAH
jgi:hypothetical protein